MTERWLSRVFQRQVLYRIDCERRMKNCRPKFIQIHHLLFLQLIFFNWRTPCRWVIRTTHPRPVILSMILFGLRGYQKHWSNLLTGARSRGAIINVSILVSILDSVKSGCVVVYHEPESEDHRGPSRSWCKPWRAGLEVLLSPLWLQNIFCLS